MAQIWLSRDEAPAAHNFVYISIADGVGTGLVIGGELIRGHNQVVGEFGHRQPRFLRPVKHERTRCPTSAANGLRGAVPRWKVDIDNDQGFSRFAIGTLRQHLPASAHG